MAKLNIHRESNRAHVRFPVQIDLKLWWPLREMAFSSGAATIKRWVFDLADSRGMDDSGIGALMCFAGWTHQYNAELRLVNVHADLKLRLTASGFKVYPA